ncbi:NAD-dependent epimerase/dehydratase family protein [Paenibacillus ginsengihumi]|jgi:UDP-glucose 4-epimerase|uniref:NAD-dependent epimerase/dehydratase family protein n=1 Tax=Paenibacillus ginsengihumi TaxID=431596 RepID=UPI000381BB9D|nr:NAD-dependent epimerase/dehydratase family protein [Paenibacillus ginsengihumi]
MRAIVTGGAGFIGSHLAEALVAEGADVHIVDNLRTGFTEHVPPGATLHQLDIRSAEAVQLFRSVKPDVVFHQAAQVDVQRSVADPGYDASVNIAGTANILQACLQASVKKLIYASSCAVYGELETGLIKEGDPTEPISFYGISKLTPEAYLRVFGLLYGLDYTVLRYANVYGPRQTPKGEGGVVAIFIDRLKQGLPLVVYGDGEQTRDFVYVGDVVRANLAAASRGSGRTVQVATASATTVNELVQWLANIHGAPIQPEYRPERPGDIRHSCLDNRLAKEILGWTPRYDVYRGLKETYDYTMRS